MRDSGPNGLSESLFVLTAILSPIHSSQLEPLPLPILSHKFTVSCCLGLVFHDTGLQINMTKRNCPVPNLSSNQFLGCGHSELSLLFTFCHLALTLEVQSRELRLFTGSRVTRIVRLSSAFLLLKPLTQINPDTGTNSMGRKNFGAKEPQKARKY